LRFQFQQQNLSFRLLCGDENDFTSKYFIWKTLAETVTGLPVFKLAT
jgi:hypothetical protein